MDDKVPFLIFTYLLLIVLGSYSTPIDSSLSLVASSIEKPNLTIPNSKHAIDTSQAKIDQIYITSSINNRFSSTTMVSKVKNTANTAQETTFSVVIPDTAFISGFNMEINGKNYTALVKEKEEAANIFNKAVQEGSTAAHVTTRDSNHFTFSVNMEPEAKATFYLTYEELLQRKNGKYELIINIYPKQLVNDINVEVIINENRRIKNVNIPSIRSGNEIENDNLDLSPRAFLQLTGTKAVVKFSPNLERQKQVAHILGTNEEEGFAGQFVVQYDVERDPTGGEVLVQDGYFVHFFAPSELEPLPKHIIFVLDVSASMSGQKIEQLRQAMLKILDDLHEKDLFSLVLFSSMINVVDVDNIGLSVRYPSIGEKLSGYCLFSLTNEHYDNLDKYKFPNPFLASKENIGKAKEIIRNLQDYGSTDILSALNVGLHLAKLGKQKNDDNVDRQSIIMFLTDGEPTIRETSTDTIEYRISNLNSVDRTPIFTLSFGDEADKKFLQKIALENLGFLRHIYEAADASLQLQDFYQQISSPLLSNVTFKYNPSITSLTKTHFPIYFDGSEVVVAGYYGKEDIQNPTVGVSNTDGSTSLESTVHQAVSNIERLWAYLTIKQLLENDKTLHDNESRKRVTDLALKYSFVTPVSSLVIVKPDGTSTFNTNDQRESITERPLNIVHTTPFCRELYITTTETPDLLTLLPWLNDALDDNKAINLPSGKYKLGLNETLLESGDCPKTPLNKPGKCKLLHTCSIVFSYLTSLNEFSEHSCILKNEYAGICCPEK